jgi:hypothetical protein
MTVQKLHGRTHRHHHSATQQAFQGPVWAGYGQSSDFLDELILKAERQINGVSAKGKVGHVAAETARVMIPVMSDWDEILSGKLGAGRETSNILFQVLNLKDALWAISLRNRSLEGGFQNYLKGLWNTLSNRNHWVESYEYLKGLNDDQIKQVLGWSDSKHTDIVKEDLSDLRQYLNLASEIETSPEVRGLLASKGKQFGDLLAFLDERTSPTKQILGFGVFPMLGQGIFQYIARPFIESGDTFKAQIAAILGVSLMSTQKFLITDAVWRHIDYSGIDDLAKAATGGRQVALQRLAKIVPFMKVGTLVSHNFSPILQILGFMFNFNGAIGKTESNTFGKVTDFFSSILSVLTPISMLGFALGHLQPLVPHVNEAGVSQKYQAKFANGYNSFGFWANIIGFGAGLVSQIASLYIENNIKKIDEKFKPILTRIQDSLKAEEEKLVIAVKSGKMTKEEAIQKLTTLEEYAKMYLKEKILPVYEAEMKNWKTAQWVVETLSWLSSLGISAQMLTGGLRQSMQKACARMDRAVIDGEKMNLLQAYWATTKRESNNSNAWATLKLLGPGGPLLSPLILGMSFFTDGISTVFGSNSPFAGSNNGLVSAVENFRKSPIYQVATTAGMFV